MKCETDLFQRTQRTQTEFLKSADRAKLEISDRFISEDAKDANLIPKEYVVQTELNSKCETFISEDAKDANKIPKEYRQSSTPNG